MKRSAIATSAAAPRVPVSLDVWADTGRQACCRSCQAPLRWFQLVTSGAWHPFNAGPVVVAAIRERGGRRVLTLTSADSHFATCPDATLWRKRRMVKA